MFRIVSSSVFQSPEVTNRRSSGGAIFSDGSTPTEQFTRRAEVKLGGIGAKKLESEFDGHGNPQVTQYGKELFERGQMLANFRALIVERGKKATNSDELIERLRRVESEYKQALALKGQLEEDNKLVNKSLKANKLVISSLENDIESEKLKTQKLSQTNSEQDAELKRRADLLLQKKGEVTKLKDLVRSYEKAVHSRDIEFVQANAGRPVGDLFQSDQLKTAISELSQFKGACDRLIYEKADLSETVQLNEHKIELLSTQLDAANASIGKLETNMYNVNAALAKANSTILGLKNESTGWRLKNAELKKDLRAANDKAAMFAETLVLLMGDSDPQNWDMAIFNSLPPTREQGIVMDAVEFLEAQSSVLGKGNLRKNAGSMPPVPEDGKSDSDAESNSTSGSLKSVNIPVGLDPTPDLTLDPTHTQGKTVLAATLPLQVPESGPDLAQKQKQSESDSDQDLSDSDGVTPKAPSQVPSKGKIGDPPQKNRTMFQSGRNKRA